jgi:hypothetical protein
MKIIKPFCFTFLPLFFLITAMGQSNLESGKTNTLQVNQQASIVTKFPGGTNYYRYQVRDSLQLIKVISHKIRVLNPGLMGGPIEETFIIKALKPGSTIVYLINDSFGALEKKKSSGNPHEMDLPFTVTVQ